MRVTIIGGGIMGLAAAWGLARRGHAITLIDQGRIPNPLGASADQHRLIRHCYGAEAGYTAMVDEAHAAWDLLWLDLGENLYVPTGTLLIASGATAYLEATAASLDRLSKPYERLDPASLGVRFPLLDAGGVQAALYLATGGLLLATRIATALALRLRRTGVTLVPGTAVSRIDTGAARVTLADGARVEADRLIVAAGAWLPGLLPAYGARVTASRQVTVALRPAAGVAQWAALPMVLDIDKDAGFYLVPPAAGTDLKLGDHSFSLTGDPDAPRMVEAGEIEALLATAGRRLPGLDGLTLAGARVGFYTVTPDERFIVELVDRAWVLSPCTGHGFKFAAAIGLRLAEAIEGECAADAVTRWAAGQVEPE
ncbi:MAG: FAD-dependent oxidoreductase [Alphaproteobacteria bacterium]|nr:FAD-dependent oxidoreductase [Alphaproteobacteria bacterium]